MMWFLRMTDGTMVPHSIFSAVSVIEPMKNTQTGLFFCTPPICSVFIDFRWNMFRDCVEEDSSEKLLIDINSDASMRLGGSVNNRLEVDSMK